MQKRVIHPPLQGDGFSEGLSKSFHVLREQHQASLRGRVKLFAFIACAVAAYACVLARMA